MELLPLKLYGINSDLPSSEDAEIMFTNGKNVKFDDGYVKKSKGYVEVFSTPSIAPINLLNIETSIISYWIYAGLNKIYATDGTTEFDITPVATIFTAIDLRWSKTIFNGIPIFTNKTETPIYWDTGPTSPMVAIPGWVSGDKCDVIRSYKNYLIAINVTTGGIKYNNLIKWSSAASAGALPSSWTPASTNDAGDKEFSETDDILIDGLTLRDSFIIYKRKTCHVMRYIGGRYVFKFDGLFDNFGALSEGCVVEFDQQHAVLSIDDFIVHDGNTFKSVIDGKMRKLLFSSINSDYIETCFLVHNSKDNEIWICFPYGTSNIPNYALVWNYREDMWFPFRDIPDSYDIQIGAYSDSSIDLTWDGDGTSWDSDTTKWDERTFSPVSNNLIAADYTNAKLHLFSDVYDANGVNYTSYIEKLSMPLIDSANMKLISEVWPDIEAADGTIFTIKVGFQKRPNNSIIWITKTFTVGTDEKVNLYGKGRFISYRVESSTGVSWRMKKTTQFNIGVCGKY